MEPSWKPSASIKTLHARAKILGSIRQFFSSRGLMEVETPVLCHTSVTDPHIQSIPVLVQEHPNAKEKYFYLQTSPEYAMKRLLAAGSGPIFQLTKAFRQGEVGRLHNSEFTMLEWYRPDFTHHDLMDEMDEFLQFILQMPPAKRQNYAELFQSFLKLDPHHASLDTLKSCAAENGISVADNEITDRDTWLNLLLTHCIEPHLGKDRPCFIYDFPASQAALARIQEGPPRVASRFEVYIHGIELANGLHELQDVNEQRKRFENNLLERKELGLPSLPIDQYFLAALKNGLPDCAGVALGVDRLIMIALKANKIADVLSFDFPRA